MALKPIRRSQPRAFETDNAFLAVAPSKLAASYSARPKQEENASSEAVWCVQDYSEKFRIWQTRVPIALSSQSWAAILPAKTARESQVSLPQSHTPKRHGQLSNSDDLRPASKIRAPLFSS